MTKAVLAALSLAVLVPMLGCWTSHPSAPETIARVGPPATAPFALAPLPYSLDETTLPFEAGASSKAHWGVAANGSGYRIEVPDEWNGDLLVSLQGGGATCVAESGLNCELSFGPAPLREILMARGVAWATTTYSDYRLAPALRAREAVELAELFEERFGKAKRVFLSGMSFGGVATLTALETYPDRFAGALPLCTGLVVEGFTTFYDLNLVALALSARIDPGLATTLAGFALPVDVDDWSGRVAPKIIAALELGAAGGQTAEASILREIVRRTTGGARPTFDTAFDQSVIPMLVHYLGIGAPLDVGGRSSIDNAGTQYRWESRDGEPLTAAEAELNARIPRFSCDESVCFVPGPEFAGGPFGGMPRYTGRIQTPSVFLQDIGDLTAPFAGAALYAEAVAGQGRSEFLVQRGIRDTRHCSFREAELAEAFDDLVEWVETGKRPTGDDFLEPATVSDPAFGCQFTRTAREDDASFGEACR